MTSVPRPEIEDFKKFHLLDLISSRHLNYLRDKSLVVTYSEGSYLFKGARSASMNYYLLEGCVRLECVNQAHKDIHADSGASYCSLEDKLPTNASAFAKTQCEVLQLSRILVEQYFSWNTTGEYNVVDISRLENAELQYKTRWMSLFLESILAKNLSEREAQYLFAQFSESRVREAQVVVHFGEVLQNFYIVKSGTATLTEYQGDTRTIGMGDFFGDESLVPNAASSIQVTMNTSGVLGVLAKEDFDKILKRTFIKHIDPKHVRIMDTKSYQIVDVRLAAEYKSVHVKGSINIPINALKRRLHELDKRLMVFVSNESGARGEQAIYVLQRAGYRAYLIGGRRESVLKRLIGFGRE